MPKLTFYYCNRCKNIEVVVGNNDADILCCGEKMVKLEPNTVDAAREKHVPAIHIEDGSVNVFVGEVEHPMEQIHYITKICVVTNRGDVYLKSLRPGEKPEATFDIGNSTKIEVYAYCNNHGLWKSEQEI